MIYTLNIAIAAFLAFFCFEVFPKLSVNALASVLLFGFWYGLLWALSYFYDKDRHFKKVPKVVGLILFYLGELFLASLWVAYEVITPSARARPGVYSLQLRARTDVEITLLANLITLTPGTLAIDVSADRKVLYVHDIHIKNDDMLKRKREISEGFERRILDITR